MRIAKRPFVIALSGIALISMLAAGFAVFTVGGAHAAGFSGQIVHLTRVGSSSFASAAAATDHSTQANEIDTATLGDDADAALGGGDDEDSGVNRTPPGAKTGHGKTIGSSARAKSNPELGTHFQGLNLFDQRFANGGNQFTVEPPDQGLCAGNGFVLESVNDVLQVYNTAGTPLLNGGNAVDLNTFYKYPAAIVRVGTGVFGPSITDPVCVYDQAIGRFVQVVLTLDRVGTTSALAGPNHLDIAVSDSGDPTGTWTIFKLPVQNDGTQGTPDHGCVAGPRTGPFVHGPCLGDYPHIGADANGIYLTTNEFDLAGPFFHGAQVYGIGNTALTGGPLNAVLFNTASGPTPDGVGAGFTVWPAQSPDSQFDTDNGGTEFFLSSDAVFFGTSDTILQWTMTNTSSLNAASPSPSLSAAAIGVDDYAPPPRAKQPAGNRPLSDCIADLTVLVAPNLTCATVIAGISPTSSTLHNNTAFGGPNGNLNSNDSRMQQVMYANGKLWGALDTAVTIGTENRAGIAYYVINPNSQSLVLQGQAGQAGTDFTYPAIGVTTSGRGVIAFTLTGDSDYPSAAYAGLDASVGMGDVHVAAAGAGSWDGFTSYVRFGAGRPRWGDYGAAAVVGGDIWIASEYVAQTCTYASYLVDPTCGNTRAPLGNWSTHISKVTP